MNFFFHYDVWKTPSPDSFVVFWRAKSLKEGFKRQYLKLLQLNTQTLEEHLFHLNVVAVKRDRELCTHAYKPAKACRSSELWTSVLWWPLVDDSSMDRDDRNVSGNQITSFTVLSDNGNKIEL